METIKIKPGFKLTGHNQPIAITASAACVPGASMVKVGKPGHRPRLGDIALVQVTEVGHHGIIEQVRSPEYYPACTFSKVLAGRLLIGAFANRYATEEFEGIVPESAVTELDLLSRGGALGSVVGKNSAIHRPTRLSLKGYILGEDGNVLNTRQFTPKFEPNQKKKAKLILAVGSGMDAGKTTSAAAIVSALSRAEIAVAAGKATGTVGFKDPELFFAAGARAVLDFGILGYPSTYQMDSEELKTLFWSVFYGLQQQLAEEDPAEDSYVIIELADGILQQETELLLEDPQILAATEAVMCASNSALGASAADSILRKMGYDKIVHSGRLVNSELGLRELEKCCLGARAFNASDIGQKNSGEILNAFGI